MDKKRYKLGRLNTNDEISFPLLDINVGKRQEFAYEFSYYFPKCCLNPISVNISGLKENRQGVYFFLSYKNNSKILLSDKETKIYDITPDAYNTFILHILYDKTDPGYESCVEFNDTVFNILTKCDDRHIIDHHFSLPIKYTPPLNGELSLTAPVSSPRGNDAVLSTFAWGCCEGNYVFDLYRSDDNIFGNKSLLRSNDVTQSPFQIHQYENLSGGYYWVHIRSFDYCEDLWVSRFIEPYPTLTFSTIPILKRTKCVDDCTERDADCFEMGEGTKKRRAWNISRNGFNDGIVQVNITNGTGNFYYFWDGPFETENEALNLLPLESNNRPDLVASESEIETGVSKGDLINAPAGWYALTVSDDYGNIESRTIRVDEPPLFSIEIDATDAQLPNTPTGSAHVQIDGNTGPYRYFWKVIRYFNSTPLSNCNDPRIWDNPAYLDRIREYNKLPPQLDEQAVVNARMEFWDWYCEWVENSYISESGRRIYKSDINYEELRSDVPPPEDRAIDWSWAWYTPKEDGLFAGFYKLYVLDCTNNLIRQNVTINNPPILHFCVRATDACIHEGLGKLDFLIENGTPPFRIKFNPSGGYNRQIDKEPPFYETIENVSPGNYDITIYDDLGQKIEKNVIVFEPSEWEVEVISEDIKLTGSNTGFAELKIFERDINSWIFSQNFTYKWRQLPYNGNDSNDELVFSNSPILDNLGPGTYEVEVTPVPILCQESKKVIVTIEEPEEIDFNFLNTCDCCNGTEGFISIFDISGGALPDPDYKVRWFYNGLLVQEDGTVLEKPFEGEYLVRVEDKEGNFRDKTILIESTEGVNFNISDFSTDPIEWNSNEGWFEVEILRDPVEPLYWELEYKDLEGAQYERINLKLETVNALKFQVIDLKGGFYRIRGIDRCGVEEEEIFINELNNPCANEEVISGGASLVFDNNPIVVDPEESKNINFTLTLNRDLCCTSNSKIPSRDGTAFFDIVSPYPTFSFRTEFNPRARVVNGGKTLQIEEPPDDKTAVQEIRGTIRYNGNNTNETVLIIRGNEPCFGEYVIPLNVSNCCPEGCCEDETCCPDSFLDCCCPDNICQSPDHPLFDSCCDCSKIPRETIALFCTNPEKYQTSSLFSTCCDCQNNIIYRNWVCEDEDNPGYVDCCPCSELSKEELDRTVCNDPEHPQFRDCCNCREHRLLRNQVCLESGPDDPLYDICCPCDSIKDVVCDDPNHPRYVECCDPCPENCCEDGTCPDISLCCGCNDFPLEEICGNVDHPLYDRCCGNECCNEDNQIVIDNARAEFTSQDTTSRLLESINILDPLSNQVQKGRLIFDYNPSCCGDQKPEPKLLQEDQGFRIAPGQEIPFGKGNNQIIKDFSLDIEYQKVSDSVANQFLNNRNLNLDLELGCCPQNFTGSTIVSIPICCGNIESTTGINATPCAPKYEIRKYQMGKMPGRIVFIFNNQYGPDVYRIRYNGQIVAKLPDATNTIVANQYIDNMYRAYQNFNDAQKNQLRNGEIVTDTGTSSGTHVPIFKDNNYYNTFQTTQDKLPDDSLSWLGRQRDRVGGIGRMGFDYNPNPEGPFEIELEIISYTYVNYFSVYCPGQYQKTAPFLGNERTMVPCGLDKVDGELYTEEYLNEARHYTYLNTIDCQNQSLIIPKEGNLNDAYIGWEQWNRSDHEYNLKCCGICSSEFHQQGSQARLNRNSALYNYYNPTPCKGKITESDCSREIGRDLYGNDENRQMYRDIKWAGNKPSAWVSNKDQTGSNFSPCKDLGINLKFFYGEYDVGIDYPDLDGTFFNYNA